ncbi:MAG: hypothetical protein H6Q74_221 [Firmicutes bacterium]|nr:hypothetical protein [Bacillota bacterium]
MKKTIIAILMGLFFMGGTATPYISTANASDFVQWYMNTDVAMQRVANTINISETTVSYFMDKGYKPVDVAMAGLLAIRTINTDSVNIKIDGMSKILAMKDNSNNWSDVAQTLGVDHEAYQQDMDKANSVG